MGKDRIHKIELADKETRDRVRFLKIFSYIGIPIGLILLIEDIFMESWLTFNLTLAFLAILTLNLLQIKLARNYKLGFWVAILAFAGLIASLFLYGDGNIFVWIGPFGAAAFFLLGSRRGFIISMSFFILISLGILTNNLGLIEIPYPQSLERLSPDFVASIIILFLFILIFQEAIEKKQKNIEEALKQEEGEHLKDEVILSIIETGLITANEAGTVTFINRHGEELLRVDRSEIIGKSITDVIKLEKNGEILNGKNNPLNQQPAKNGTKINIDDNINIRRFSDGSFPAGMNIIHTEQNTETRLVVVFSDLTNEKEIVQFKEAFLSSIQHQITIPLSILKWNVELFRETDENLQKTGLTKNDIINETQLAIERIVSIQNKILVSSRLEQGFFSKDIEYIDPVEITKETIKYLYLTAKRKRVLVNFDHNENIQPVRANKVFLSTVLENIISNAIKFSHNDDVVDIQIEQEEDGVLFKIIDKGIGISEEEQKYIFNKFFRSEKITKKSYEGSGLGLYISKILVTHMFGEIWFESKEGVGTTFFIKIPNTPR